MKETILLLSIILSLGMHAQDVNTKNNIAAEGYDVVAYFDGEALKGSTEFTAAHEGARYLFTTQKNLTIFKGNPSRFIPQYGGYCAYAIATTGKKVGVNPRAFQIKDGKLFLFYKTIFADTLEKWKEQDPTVLQQKADENWEKMAMKKN